MTRREFKNWLHVFGIASIVGIAVSVLCIVIMAAVAEKRQWERFADDHKCKVIEKQSNTTAWTLTDKGLVPTFVQGKTAYRCDNGVIYWRE